MSVYCLLAYVRYLMKLITLVFIVFFPFICFANSEQGALLFKQHCAACHGSDGQGGVGVPLSLPAFIDNVDNEFLRITIKKGRLGRVMPAFEKELDEQQIRALVAYIRQWGSKTAPKRIEKSIIGDKQQGKKLFAQYCARCHGAQGQGAKGTGVTFSRKRDLPILPPALNNPGFLAAATDEMIKHVIQKGRKKTPMPAFSKILSKQQINNLVAYIRDFENHPIAAPDNHVDENILKLESPYSLQKTVKLIEAAIEGNNFKHIRTQYFEQGYVKEGEENKKEVIIYFCNFRFLFQALNIDPRAGLFLPCRVTVVQEGEQVYLLAVNPKRLSKLYNNWELGEACERMFEVYETILDDSTI